MAGQPGDPSGLAALLSWFNGAEAEFVPSTRALPPSSWLSLLDGSVLFELFAVLFEGCISDEDAAQCAAARTKFEAILNSLEELLGASYNAVRAELCVVTAAAAVDGDDADGAAPLEATAERVAALQKMVKLVLVAGITHTEDEMRQELVDNMQEMLTHSQQAVLMRIIQEESLDEDDDDEAESGEEESVDSSAATASTPPCSPARSKLVIEASSPLAPLSQRSYATTPVGTRTSRRRSLLAADEEAVAPLSATVSEEAEASSSSSSSSSSASSLEAIEDHATEVKFLKLKIKNQAQALRDNDEAERQREHQIYLSFLPRSEQAAAQAELSAVRLKALVDKHHAQQAKESMELRCEKKDLEQRVGKLTDELECLQSCELDLMKANKKITKLEKRQEDRRQIEEDYANLKFKFTQAQEELGVKSKELQQIPTLLRKLETHKTELSEQAVKLRHMKRLELENTMLREDAGMMQSHEDHLNALVATSEDRAAALADELREGGDGDGAFACAAGVTELNPEVAQRITSLETQNEELSALVKLSSVEHVRDIEAKYETAQATRESFEKELLKVEARECVLIDKLRHSNATIVQLKCDAAVACAEGAATIGADAARRALGSVFGSVADSNFASLYEEWDAEKLVCEATKLQLSGEIAAHAESVAQLETELEEAQECGRSLKESLLEAEAAMVQTSEEAAIALGDAQQQHSEEILALEDVIESGKQRATEERRQIERAHERTRQENADAMAKADREAAVMLRQRNMLQRHNRELQEETIKKEEQLAMYGKGHGEDASEVERLRREYAKLREDNRQLRNENEAVREEAGSSSRSSRSSRRASHPSKGRGGKKATNASASEMTDEDDDDGERGYESAMRERDFQIKKLKEEKETLELFRGNQLGKYTKLEKELKGQEAANEKLEVQLRNVTLKLYRLNREVKQREKAAAAAAEAEAEAEANVSMDSPSFESPRERMQRRAPLTATPLASSMRRRSSVSSSKVGCDNAFPLSFPLLPILSYTHCKYDAAFFHFPPTSLLSQLVQRAALASGSRSTRSPTGLEAASSSKLVARSRSLKRQSLSLPSSESAENSPIVLNRAELAKKGATLATAASNDPDDGQQECAQQ